MFKRNQYQLNMWAAIYDLQASFLGSIEMSKQMRLSPIGHLRDMRTIHMGSGRQSGKTSWVLNEVINRGNQMLFVKDVSHKQVLPEQPIVSEQVAKAKVVGSIYTYHDLVAMLRTQPEKIKKIISETERVFFNDADFLPMKEILRLLADDLPEDVVIVAVH